MLCRDFEFYSIKHEYFYFLSAGQSVLDESH